MDELHFLILCVIVAVGAWAAADLAFPEDLERRTLSALGNVALIALFVVLTLGTAERLTATWATAVTCACTSIFIGLRWQTRRASPKPHNRWGLPIETEPFVRISALAIFGGVAAMWTAVICLTPLIPNIDDFSYHAPVVVQWVKDASITLAPFSYQAHFPFNAEAVSVWLLLPLSADGSAGIAGLYWGVLLVGAIVTLLLHQRHSIATALLIAGLAISSPLVLENARAFAATDLAGAAMLMAALAMLGTGSGGARVSLPSAGYAGLFSGFAVGCKITFAPAVPILLLFQMRKAHPRRLSTGIIFLLGVAVTGSYWYVRNWLITGNPVFPASLGPFAGPFGAAEQYRTKLIRWIAEAPTDFDQWALILKLLADWPVGLFFVAVVGYGGAIWHCLVKRDDLEQLPLLATGIVLFTLFPFMPFSGTFDQPDGVLFVPLRYILAPYFIGIVLFAGNLRPGNPRRALWIGVAFLSLATALAGSSSKTAVALLAGSLAGLLIGLTQPSLPARTMPILIGIALASVAVTAPLRQRLTDAYYTTFGTPHFAARLGFRTIETLPPGSRITWFGPHPYMYYPYFGRRWQHTPVATYADGSIYPHAHVRFRAGESRWWWHHEKKSAEGLDSRLLESGIDYVFMMRTVDGGWPTQKELLDRSKIAFEVYNDGGSSIWKLSSNR